MQPETVTVHLWGVPPGRVPGALRRMATGRRPLRRAPGLTFGKLVGTGDGRTFTARDADPLHWGVVAAWRTRADADAFHASSPLVRSWRRVAREELAVRLRPVASRGRWAGREPFGAPVPTRTTGAVASITRARLHPSRARSFWRAVPPVSADLHRVPGLRLAVGIGEAPVGLQGTFSLWDSTDALREFAHGRKPHVDVVRRTMEEGWYAEELFARFEVLSVEGTFAGRQVSVG